MSILEKMRNSTDSTTSQIVLVVIIVAMFFWYSPTSGDQSATVAVVNGTQIRDTEYFPRYREAYARAQQRGMTSDQEELLRQQVKEDLARDEVLRQLAVLAGFTASDRDIGAAIRRDRRFFNPETDLYDEEIYKDYRQSRSVQELEKGFETKVLINKLRWSVMTAADLPEARVREQYVERESKVDLQYVRINPESILAGIEVTEADTVLWISENAAKIQDQYELDFGRLYDFPDRVELSVIRLQKEDDGPTVEALTLKLNAVRDQLSQGQAFETMARKWSEDESAVDGGDLAERRVPTLTQNERDALGELNEGDLTEVLETASSVFFYRLNTRTPAETMALETVTGDIALSLIRTERALEASSAIAQSILDEWVSASQAPADTLVANGLELDQSGLVNVASRRLGGPPETMVEDGLSAADGTVLPVIYEDKSGGQTVWVVGQVGTRQKADMDNYNTYKNRMHEAALFNLRDTLWLMWVDEQVAKATLSFP